MDIRHDTHDTLTPERAADLLGVSPRTVRRWIASGKLAGTTVPCATTRAAVDALRREQQARGGEVLGTADIGGDNDANGDTYGVALASALLTELRVMREEMLRLSREVGRLEAELAQARGAPGGHNGHKGHAGRALARLVPWLRG